MRTTPQRRRIRAKFFRQPPLIEKPLEAGVLDLAVGIPSYNEADTIGFVTEQVAAGLERYFPHFRAAVVNADNFSADGTRDAFLAADTGSIQKVYLSTPPGVTGKGNNFLNLFSYLDAFDSKAVVVVDADLQSITPEWIRALASPVLEGYDFVTPLYSRNEYDGTITNLLCYPLLTALLNQEVRQPIGGDFAFSSRLMRHWLGCRWHRPVRHYGVDVFMTSEALLGDFRLAQVLLGSKVHKPSAPKLGPMFTEVVDTLFSLLWRSRQQWVLNGQPPERPPLCAAVQEELPEPQPMPVDYKSIKKAALAGFASTNGLLREVLPSDLAAKLGDQFQQRRLRISASTWARIVFSFLRTYGQHRSPRQRLQLVEALKSLYFARVASFIRETLELDHDESEQRAVDQARIFRRYRRLVVG